MILLAIIMFVLFLIMTGTSCMEVDKHVPKPLAIFWCIACCGTLIIALYLGSRMGGEFNSKEYSVTREIIEEYRNDQRVKCDTIYTVTERIKNDK